MKQGKASAVNHALIRDWLRDHPTESHSDCARALGCHRSTVCRHAKEIRLDESRARPPEPARIAYMVARCVGCAMSFTVAPDRLGRNCPRCRVRCLVVHAVMEIR